MDFTNIDMPKLRLLFCLIFFTFLSADDDALIQLNDGHKIQGQFVGTYMDYVHILVGMEIKYFPCVDINFIKSLTSDVDGEKIDFDCSVNTVTADILFPPQLDPMTGEIRQILPDIFNPDIRKSIIEKEKEKESTVSVEGNFVTIDGVKYERVTPEKELAEIIESKKISGFIESSSYPKVTPVIKTVSIENLTKNQKKRYNQNRMRIFQKRRGLFPKYNWRAYVREGIFFQKTYTQSEFFEITGYPEKARIAKHNRELQIKNMLFGGLSYLVGGMLTTREGSEVIGLFITIGGVVYCAYDFFTKKIDGAEFKDALIVAERYNNELIQKISNESD